MNLHLVSLKFKAVKGGERIGELNIDDDGIMVADTKDNWKNGACFDVAVGC